MIFESLTGVHLPRPAVAVVAGLTGMLMLAGSAAPGQPQATRAIHPVRAEPASPFAGTPAEAFPVGAAGIVLPEPAAIPDGYRINHLDERRDITVDEVATALERVRATLIAARLDPAMLVHHYPVPWIETLAPTYATQWAYPLPFILDWYDSAALANYATMLAPGVELAAPPRVTGKITFGASTDSWARRDRTVRVLEIVTTFIWVYALQAPASEPRIVVVRGVAAWLLPTDYGARFAWIDDDPNDGIHRRDGEARAWGVDCDLYEKEGQLRPAGPTKIPRPVFDLDQPLEPVPGCRPDDFSP